MLSPELLALRLGAVPYPWDLPALSPPAKLPGPSKTPQSHEANQVARVEFGALVISHEDGCDVHSRPECRSQARETPA